MGWALLQVSDESELELYEEVLSEWNKKQEEKKQLIVIEHKSHRSSKVPTWFSSVVHGLGIHQIIK